MCCFKPDQFFSGYRHISLYGHNLILKFSRIFLHVDYFDVEGDS